MLWVSHAVIQSVSHHRSFVWFDSFLHSFIRSFVPSFVCLFVRSFVRSFVPLFIRSFVRLFVRSFVRLFVCLFVAAAAALSLTVAHCHSLTVGWLTGWLLLLLPRCRSLTATHTQPRCHHGRSGPSSVPSCLRSFLAATFLQVSKEGSQIKCCCCYRSHCDRFINSCLPPCLPPTTRQARWLTCELTDLAWRSVRNGECMNE